MSINVKLRPYQVLALKKLFAVMAEGVFNTVFSLPTGAGKTILACYLVEKCVEQDKRVIFVVDRIPLIEQTSDTFDRLGIKHGIIQGGNKRWAPDLPVQIGSIQTLRHRGWPDADLIIVDECHTMHAAVINHISQRKVKVVGLTATPMTVGMGKVYDRLVTSVTTKELTDGPMLPNGERDQSYLVPFRLFAPSEPDMEGAPTKAGEWTRDEAARRSMPIIGDCVGEYVRRAMGKKFIAFGCNVAHCEEMQRQFMEAGVVTELYTYRTDDDARTALVEEFRKSDSTIRGLISVATLSKGFDVTDVECVIMARPLKKSLAEHIQILGRGLRGHQGKTECIVLDHSGNCYRFWDAMHDFIENGVHQLDDGTRKERLAAKATAEKKPMKCPDCACLHDPLPACPSCGFIYKRATVIEKVAGTLHEVKGKSKKAALTPESKRKFYTELRQYALDHQKGDSWVLANYREKFNEWPAPGTKGLPPSSPSPETLGWLQYKLIAFKRSKAKAARA
jgi:superfamily II DNA or RNA helicase